MVFVVGRRAKRHVVHSPPLPGPPREGLAAPRDVELGVRTPTPHLEHVYVGRAVRGIAVLTHRAQLHHMGQDMVGRAQAGHAYHNGSQAPDLVCEGHRALFPGDRGIAAPTVVDQREPLALGILEVERGPAVPLPRALVRYAELAQALRPPPQRVHSVHAQMRPHDAVRASALGRRRPIEERDVRAGAARAVRVEEVVDPHVVLIHAPLHQPHPEHLAVEPAVVANARGDRGQVVESGELHGARLLVHRGSDALPTLGGAGFGRLLIPWERAHPHRHRMEGERDHILAAVALGEASGHGARHRFGVFRRAHR